MRNLQLAQAVLPRIGLPLAAPLRFRYHPLRYKQERALGIEMFTARIAI